MALLLARTADRLYWGARYIERAEDTARIVRAYNELVTDFASAELLRWEPLAAIHGNDHDIEAEPDDPAGELSVLQLLLADRGNHSSILSTVGAARENLRTTREVMPREAWQAVNQLSQYVEATASAAVGRQLRDRFLLRVIEISRRLDGILESTMSRGASYSMLRLGRLVERADMTTRVLGVAAAGVLALERAHRDDVVNEQVRWMSVLRSVSALQMYQRAVKGPINGTAVVQFLMSYSSFPRSVQGCFDEIRPTVLMLPRPDRIIASLDAAAAVLASVDLENGDAERLDRSMDRVQTAIAELASTIHDTYVGESL
jgi:uncharacterized alpha-E superfamily protein